MYSALSDWIRNNLAYNYDTKTDSDQEYSKQVQSLIKVYNNTIIINEKHKSRSKNIVKMDVEIGGKYIKTIEANLIEKAEQQEAPPTVLTEKGDIVKKRKLPQLEDGELAQLEDLSKTMKSPVPSQIHSTINFSSKYIVENECKKRDLNRMEKLQSEQEQINENSEVLDIPLPFRSIGKTSSLTNLHNLLEQCPQPQPPLTHKQIKLLQLNEDQAMVMKEEVQKMKSNMERLHDLIKKFHCTEKFKQDIDYIVANVNKAIAKAEHLREKQESKFTIINKDMDKKQL